MSDSLKAIETQRKIIDLSFYAFNERGYTGVSMDEVARELRISKKTIYKLFSSKEEILETGLGEALDKLESEAKFIMSADLQRSVFYALSELYLKYLGSISRVLKAEIQEHVPHLADRLLLFENQVFKKSFRNLLKSGRSEKILEYPTPSRETAEVILSFLNGISEARPDYATWAIKSFFRGFVSKSKKSK